MRYFFKQKVLLRALLGGKVPHLGQISTRRSRSKGRPIPDLEDLAHVVGWEPYNLHDLVQVS